LLPRLTHGSIIRYRLSDICPTLGIILTSMITLLFWFSVSCVSRDMHWTRTTETTGGELSYKAPIYDIPNGILRWLFQVLLLEATLHTLGDGDVPLLDIVAYGGYTFAAESVVLLASIVSTYFFMQSHCGNAFVWECSSSRSWREFWSLRWQVLRSIQASATISCYLFLMPNSHCSVGLEMLVFRRLFLK